MSQPLDLYLRDLHPELSRKSIQRVIDAGGVTINGKKIWIRSYGVKPSDKVDFFFEDERLKKQKPKVTSTDILHEDNDFLIIDKPPGLSVEDKDKTDSPLLDSMYHKGYEKGGLYIVHRLDKDTGGLIIIAKTLEASERFELLFKERKIEKTYLAYVQGRPKLDFGTIDRPIVKHKRFPNRYTVARGGKEAITKYKVIKFDKRHSMSLIEFYPQTGRPHQIRVHAAEAMLHPIIGDTKYNPINKGDTLQLLAYKLSFTYLGKKYHFTSKQRLKI
jgi:23S rRNA pseudouridine1911/1915/1917 synthase